jgi:CheY-like chemotaxis protein
MPNCNGLHVLVVDDEQIIADTLVLILNSRGFDAKAAYDGEAAAELAMALKPDILISDIVMPRMTGIELALFICRQLPECRIVLISGSGQGMTDALLQRAGEDRKRFEILRKPIRPEALLDHLAQRL